MRQSLAENGVFEQASSLGNPMNLALRAAQAAGSIVRDGYGKLTAIEEKDVGDLVSFVDLEADRAAQAVLRADSDCPILSEELNSTQEIAESMWIVDPLDASGAFLMQAGPEYPAVLVAKRVDGETSLGVAYFPLTDDWYYAQRGRGAWKNGKRLICEPAESLADVWVEMNHYGNAEWETPFFAELRQRLRSPDGARLVTSNVPNSGVALRIAASQNCLAAAVHDNNPDHIKQGPWDIAAPQIILEEAGGVFLSPDGNRTDPFAGEPVIVARSEALANQIIDLVVREPVDS